MINNINTIIEKIDSLTLPKDGYIFTEIENVYFGKSYDGFYSFGKKVDNQSILPIIQDTKFLSLYINGIFKIGDGTEKNLSVVSLKSEDKKLIETFIRLSVSVIPEISDKKFYDYFLSLKEIFSNSVQKSETELQGLYAELYTVKYLFETIGLDLSSFYQSQDRMKFDYSISDTKKIEIKSTQKSERIHHFRQEQVNSLMYDIIVFSYLLRKDDKGLSLYELIEYCKNTFANNFLFITHIEKFIHKTTDSELQNLKFNEQYTINNLKLINANQIPKIEKTSGNGVFNIEFDSNITNCESFDLQIFKSWYKM
ncbi:PD-(D/E)XK motif protein [uncultured Treponema sp.]|uniref:PD-(D/E)XK motif protein n=1 Tax=uncultured Treponema sp. TaxID=162155 RepID=UPI0015C0B5E6|nr:PD-(D/E)XK motif protein [uncultured Treponema sp.]